MASLLSDDELDPTATATPATNTTTTGGAGGTTDNGGTTATTPTAPTAQPTTPNASIGQVTSLNQNANYQPLLDYVSGEGTAANNAITSADTSFKNTLGNWTPFGSDQQNTLNSVLSGQQPLATGQSMLNQRYSGPASIDNSSYDPLSQTYLTDAQNTQNQAGITTLLGSLRPDLTAGDRNYDALVYGGMPAYRTASQGILNDANTTYGRDQSTTSGNNAAVTQRQNDINAFNSAAQTYVQGQQGSINQAIQNQINQQNQRNQGIGNLLGSLAKSGAPLTSLPSYEMAFDPNVFQAQTISSQYGPSVYAPTTINPDNYLGQTQAQLPTFGNMATPDQITQWNNAERLLQGNNFLQPGAGYQGSQLTMNSAAFQSALNLAIQQRNAADAAWLASQQKPQPAAAAAVPDQVWNPSYGGSEATGVGANDETNAEAAAANDQAAGNAMDAGTNAADIGAGADAAAGENEGEGESESGGDTFARGGLVGNKALPRDQQLQAPRVYNDNQNAQPSLASSTFIPQPTNSNPQIMQMQQPVAAQGLQRGGYVSPHAGPPGRDTVPARVNNGEFVVRTPSVNDIGVGNMSGLNRMDRLPPAQQMAVRAALHHALSRAVAR